MAVRTDATALAVLIRNLVDNALRHTPDGGRVDLRLYTEGTNAVLRVEDTGPGIGEADLPHVFEPFYRGRRSEGEGTVWSCGALIVPPAHTGPSLNARGDIGVTFETRRKP